jgi:hypothetical protein
MTEQQQEPVAQPSALEYYQALLRWLYANGYSTLNAYEQIQAWFPGLWQAATTEVWQKIRSGEYPSAPYTR